MIRHDQPALLITSEDTAVADAIRKGECGLGGRLNSDPTSNGLQDRLHNEDRVTGFENGRAVFAKAEGARGGHVIGHTRSGKAVYENHGHYAHASFTPQDHVDAAGLNMQNAHYARDPKREKPSAKDAVFADQHEASAKAHRASATAKRGAKKSVERPDLAKSIFMLTGMEGFNEPRPENAVLKDTHGEQFSSDADKEVVAYLTTVEKINLEASPAHNPWGQPAFHGYPTVQKASSVVGEGHVPTARPVDKPGKEKVCKALDDLCKGFASLASPMTNSLPKKAKVDVSVPKVAAVKTPKMAPVAIKTPKSLASAQPVKAPKAGAKIGGKGLTAKSDREPDLYVSAFA